MKRAGIPRLALPLLLVWLAPAHAQVNQQELDLSELVGRVFERDLLPPLALPEQPATDPQAELRKITGLPSKILRPGGPLLPRFSSPIDLSPPRAESVPLVFPPALRSCLRPLRQPGSQIELDPFGIFEALVGSLSGTRRTALDPAPLCPLTEADPPAPPTVTPKTFSLRIGTFNTALLPDIARTSEGINSRYGFSEDDTQRARRIAGRILASGYDVISLEEVFDEDSRNRLVGSLHGTYPHYIEFADSRSGVFEDSGLMLFSRFPFAPLKHPECMQQLNDSVVRGAVPNYSTLPATHEILATSEGADWPDAAFVFYEDCNDDGLFPFVVDDCDSDKGVALVRIMHPNDGRIFTVALTHLQASYDEDGTIDQARRIRARAAQLRTIESLLECEAGSEGLATEDVFVFGDLNIDGDVADALHPEEWQNRFGTPGAFFTDTLHDTWRHETSELDRGLTEGSQAVMGSPRARFDYMLRNNPDLADTDSVCVQHMTVAYNLRATDGPAEVERGMGTAGYRDLSDHLGLNADVNTLAEHCSPVVPPGRAESFGPYVAPPLDTAIVGTIANAGGMQWYRFDEPGTYELGVRAIDVSPAGDIRFHVYRATDLSTPLANYHDESNGREAAGIDGKIEVFRFVLGGQGPFYVRVFHADREFTGQYHFLAHRLDCSSRDEACPLRPYEAQPITFPAAAGDGDYTSWIAIDVDPVLGEDPQKLRFVVDGYERDQLKLDIVDQSLAVLASSSGGVPRGDGTLELVADTEMLPRARTRLYMLVQRQVSAGDPAQGEFQAAWKTNLRILHGDRLGTKDIEPAEPLGVYCTDQTDDPDFGGFIPDIEDDEFTISVLADGVLVAVEPHSPQQIDNNQFRNLNDILVRPIPFVSSLDVFLNEDDEPLDGEDFHSSSRSTTSTRSRRRVSTATAT